MKKVSIVMPAHNEENRIRDILENYLPFFKDLKKKKILDFEAIVVLNNCKDKTKKIVQEYKCSELKILDFKRGGKGFAITEGFKDALKRDSDFIGFVDVDMATPPEAFYDLVKNIKNADGVIANRWDKKSIITVKQTFLRRVLSRGYNIIIRSMFLFPYRDTQCGAKLFRREILKNNVDKLVSSEWGFDVALLFCLKKEAKARIKSIPTIWNDKKESNIDVRRTPVKMFLSAVRLRLVHSPFNFIVRFYRKLPKKLKFHERKY